MYILPGYIPIDSQTISDSVAAEFQDWSDLHGPDVELYLTMYCLAEPPHLRCITLADWPGQSRYYSDIVDCSHFSTTAALASQVYSIYKLRCRSIQKDLTDDKPANLGPVHRQ